MGFLIFPPAEDEDPCAWKAGALGLEPNRLSIRQGDVERDSDATTAKETVPDSRKGITIASCAEDELGGTSGRCLCSSDDPSCQRRDERAKLELNYFCRDNYAEWVSEIRVRCRSSNDEGRP